MTVFIMRATQKQKSSCGVLALVMSLHPSGTPTHRQISIWWWQGKTSSSVRAVFTKLKGLFYDILQPLLYLVTKGSRKLSANEQFQFCWCSNSSLLQTTQIISDVCFIIDHVAYASSNKTKIVWNEMEPSLFLTQGGCVSSLHACGLGARLLPQSYQYPNLLEGTNCVGWQLHGDKECPFSGVTKSGRVWRKVSESNAQSVNAHNWLLDFNVLSAMQG